MSDWWVINGRHEVVLATLREQGDDGRWYVDGQPGWFWENENLFGNEEDAKLRAIERVLGYALEVNVPVREEYVRTAGAYAKEFREERDAALNQLSTWTGADYQAANNKIRAERDAALSERDAALNQARSALKAAAEACNKMEAERDKAQDAARKLLQMFRDDNCGGLDKLLEENPFLRKKNRDA